MENKSKQQTTDLMLKSNSFILSILFSNYSFIYVGERITDRERWRHGRDFPPADSLPKHPESWEQAEATATNSIQVSYLAGRTSPGPSSAASKALSRELEQKQRGRIKPAL